MQAREAAVRRDRRPSGPWARTKSRAAASGAPSGRASRGRAWRGRVRHDAERRPRSSSLRHQLGTDRHRHFGRSRRRRRAHVRGEVDQSRVGLMTHSRDERDRRFRRGPHDFLLVEGPQILDRAAAASNDQQVGTRHGAAGLRAPKPRMACSDLGRCTLTLNRHRPDDDVCRAAILQPVQDVADDGAGR